MAILNVNPTRMELSNLKRKLATARKGHKLLKDKRDELMRNRHMAVARSVMQDEVLSVALMIPKQEMHLEIEEKDIMSVRIPVYHTQLKTADENDIFPYGYAFTSGDLDDAVRALSEIMPKMLRLAEVEKSCQLMAEEIEKTRRRVNALEHVMIPQYEETIKFITMKLDENERSTTTRLMKVKDMMLEQAHHYKDPRDVM